MNLVCVFESDLRTCGETGRDRIHHGDATADSRPIYAHLTHSHKHTTKPQHHCGMEMPQCLKIIATDWKYIEILLEDKDEETGVWKRDSETKRGREGMLADLLRLLGRRLCVPLECISFSGFSSSSSENGMKVELKIWNIVHQFD